MFDNAAAIAADGASQAVKNKHVLQTLIDRLAERGVLDMEEADEFYVRLYGYKRPRFR